MNRHCFAVCVLASFFAYTGCSPSASTTSGPAPSVEQARPSPTSPPSPAAVKPGPTSPAEAIEITAEALGEEYAKDSEAAEKKYLGKLLRITANHLTTSGEMVYLSTGKKFPTGQLVKVSMRFPKEDDVKEFADVEQIVVGNCLAPSPGNWRS